MTLAEQVYAQTLLMAGELEEKNRQLLEVLSTAACRSLTTQLRQGLSPEDCKADFIAAASLLALAELNGAADFSKVEEFKVGDLNVRSSGVSRDVASRCLRRQAELMIGPYLKDRFAFLGV